MEIRRYRSPAGDLLQPFRDPKKHHVGRVLDVTQPIADVHGKGGIPVSAAVGMRSRASVWDLEGLQRNPGAQ